MVTSILLFILGVNSVLAFFRPKQAVGLYALLSIVAPHLRVAGYAVSYEIAGFIPVGFACLFVSSFRVKFRLEYVILIVYFILSFISTAVSVARFGAGVLWIPIFGWIRVFIIFVLVISCVDRDTIFKVVSCAILVNLLAAVAQIFVPGSLEVTHYLYAKESQSVLDRYLELGVFLRPTGTVGSPVNLGVLSLISFAVACSRLLQQIGKWKEIVVAVMSVFTGVIAMSKTAIIGVPIVLLLAVVLHLGKKLVGGMYFNPRSLVATIAALSFAGWGVWLFVSYLNEAGFSIFHYLAFLQNPLEAFETRYAGDGNTTLDVTMEVVEANWLTGVGFTAPWGEFLGDSTYVLALHAIGVFGIVLIAALYLSLSFRVIRSGDYPLFVPIIALGMTGFALPTLFTNVGVMIIGYVIVSTSVSSYEGGRVINRSYLDDENRC